MTHSGNTVYLVAGDIVTASDIAIELNISSSTITNVTIDASNTATNSNGTTCIIFDGILFQNCTFIGDITTLKYNIFAHTFDNVTFQGTFLCDFLCPELFGAKGNGVDDDTVALQTCFDVAVNTHIYRIRLLPRTYLITSTLYYKGNLSIEGTHHYNMYHTAVGSRLLVHMPSNDKFHYALDSDCYTDAVHSQRFDPLATFNSQSRLYYHGEDKDSDGYAAPILIKNLAIETDNQTFGAFRAIGFNNGLIEGVSIYGFNLGIALCKGWNFKVERTELRIGWWGFYLGGEVTTSLFQSVQCYSDHNFRTLPVLSDSPEQQFFDSLFPLNLSGYNTIARALWNDETPIRTIAYIGKTTNGTFNSCSMEKFDIGVLAENSRLTFNTPYVEDINYNIACINTGCILFNNMVGHQDFIADDCYVATGLSSRIVLNNCHPGGFYRTYSYETPSSEDYNAFYYNHKAYIVTNQDKVSKPIRYDDTSYLDYDVGDTLYVLQHHYTEYCDESTATAEEIQAAKDYADSVNSALDVYCGNYYMNPITLKAALERIKDDFNYRNVNKIVIVEVSGHQISTLIVDETYTWACKHRLTISRDRNGKTLDFRAIQNICCDVTFKKLAIQLNSSLCKVFGTACQELRFEDDYVYVNDSNYYLVDNTGNKPSDGFAKYISIYLYRQPSVHNYYRNTWNASDDATRFVVDVGGTYNGGGNS